MYVGYLLDKDSNMYPNPVRHPGLNLNHQNYVPAPPQYSDFASYHHVPGINSDPHHGQPGSTWSSPYAPSREDWHSYGPGPAASSNNPGQIGFSPTDFNPVQPPGSGLLPPPMNNSVPPLSPNAQRRNPYDWMKRSVVPSANPNNGPREPGRWGGADVRGRLSQERETEADLTGKTRTKDKYRVVYTDHQRLELEKEFHYSRYITIRRKAELAATLALTERQVKIWFQNRRAKERKVNKKKMQQQSQQASTTTPTPPTVGTTTGMGGICSSSSSNSNLVSPSALTIKEEYLS
ncbi:homeobox protein CDX-1 isoform X1 [Spea bombifrons]|uniref:homeobox protein CDX-1 isoform X1 n=1 Tax=Spea bombifrons TaxID=233779 RepID=UPI00234A5E66|nr:homeobox protein CDX-1 isoform X1 [Spea bombifrons]